MSLAIRTERQRLVVEYAQQHPFEQAGDYAKAALALNIPMNTVRHYAKQFGLNMKMPGPRKGYSIGKPILPREVNPSVPLVAKDNSLAERIRKYLMKYLCTKDELADFFEVAPKVIQAGLDELKERAVTLDCENGIYSIQNDIRPPEEPVKETLEGLGARAGHFVIGHTADWHTSSKYCREDVITKLYEWYAAEGVTTVYHAGNWCDGQAKFNEFDLLIHGVTPQIHEFLRVCPQIPGIKTKVLSGDDHEGWWVQREGINIGQLLALEAHKAGRDDIEDIGYMERDIELASGQIMRVIHAGGGSAYATSYKAQKYVESLQGGEKPRIVVMGHYHKFEFGYPREVYVLQPGCCQDQTPFMRKKQIQAHVGGCILDIHVNDGGIIDEVGCRFKSFFDKQFYEYHQE